jgi:hypothetical protein
MPGQPRYSDRSAVGDSMPSAYGSWWRSFRASVPGEGTGRGMVFGPADEGCHMLAISGTEESPMESLP